MNSSPEEEIREYLDQRGGETDATVGHLLTTFGVDEGDEEGRRRITRTLFDAGVGIDRPLRGLHTDDGVHLFVTPDGDDGRGRGSAGKGQAPRERDRSKPVWLRRPSVIAPGVAIVALVITAAVLYLSRDDRSGGQKAEPAGRGSPPSKDAETREAEDAVLRTAQRIYKTENVTAADCGKSGSGAGNVVLYTCQLKTNLGNTEAKEWKAVKSGGRITRAFPSEGRSPPRVP